MPLLTGRKPRIFKPSIPHMSALIGGRKKLPAIPARLDYADKLPADVGMMLNDQYGCCTAAGAFHARQVWTNLTAGAPDTEPDEDVLKFYERFGFRPGQPDTDNGAIEQDVLTDWAKEGLPLSGGESDPLLAFFEIDPRSISDAQRAVWECGVLYIGFTVPSGFMDSADPPIVWDDDRKYGPSEDGHCVVLTGYDTAQGYFNVISWGERDYKMTNAFFRRYVDEAYGLIDKCWVETGKNTTPLGMTVEELQAQMAALRRHQ